MTQLNIPAVYSTGVPHPTAGDWNSYMTMMHSVVRYTNTDSPVTLDNSRAKINVNTTNGPVTVILPSNPEHGYVIKNKVDFGKPGHDITLSSSSSIEEDRIEPHGAAVLEFDSTDGWFWVA